MLLSVPVSFCAMWAFLPTPEQMTLPPRATADSTARAAATKFSSRPRAVAVRASRSMVRQRRALASRVALSSGIKNLCWKRGGDKRNFQLSSFKSFPIVPRPLLKLRLFASILALVLMVGWAGCGESERFSYASETDEPSYREGTLLLKAGR